ncbi:hypothetical protein ACVR05_01635 [Streptococcus caprae]|uniref:DUF2127 domain-containing protein n=1 Tax=Streptococcus caprae TaxID=1640501 RepID=A0ABV8CXD4_9STRE
MISYEKVRQSLRSTTIGIIIVSIIEVIIYGFVLGGLVLTQAMLTNDEYRAQLDAQLASQGISSSDVAATITPLDMALLAFFALISLVITIFAIINLSRLKHGRAIIMVPYYLGVAFAGYGIISGLLKFALVTVAIQALILALFIYALLQARKLLEVEATDNDNF